MKITKDSLVEKTALTADGNGRIRHGLTIRAMIAARAMQGLLSKYTLNDPEDQDTIAQLSVQMADSLIRELNEEKPYI